MLTLKIEVLVCTPAADNSSISFGIIFTLNKASCKLDDGIKDDEEFPLQTSVTVKVKISWQRQYSYSYVSL